MNYLVPSLPLMRYRYEKAFITTVCLLLALFFTNAGEAAWLWYLLTSPAYYCLLGLNFGIILLLWLGVRWRLLKGDSRWRTALLFYPALLVGEIALCWILDDYEFDFTELTTITLPLATAIFGLLCYAYRRPAPDRVTTLKLPAGRGQVAIKPTEVSVVVLRDHCTEVYLPGQPVLRTPLPLTAVTRSLTPLEDYFHLNRRACCHRTAINGYRSREDGRLTVVTPAGAFTVSKNKAASFKKWWKAASPSGGHPSLSAQNDAGATT